MTRKVFAITGTRADYGLLLPVLRALRDDPGFELVVVGTGMHLMEEFGSTGKEIEDDGFPVRWVDATFPDDTPASMTGFFAAFVGGLSRLVAGERPEILLLLGDRPEMLAGAVVGAYHSIPIAHIHGGDRSSTVDDRARHAITKLASIHFPATPGSRDRIVGMGEDPDRVFFVGSPGLDGILHEPRTPPEEVRRIFRLPPEGPVLLVVQHPVTLEAAAAAFQMEETLKAVKALGLPALVVYPNADPGGRAMIDVIRRYERLPAIRSFPHIPRPLFLSLLATVNVLIGNSSSGIIEAASFRLPVVNIGTRQQGRDRAENVIDVPCECGAISAAVEKALSDGSFRERVALCSNPYGDGHAAERILRVLRTVELSPDLIQKRWTC